MFCLFDVFWFRMRVEVHVCRVELVEEWGVRGGLVFEEVECVLEYFVVDCFYLFGG